MEVKRFPRLHDKIVEVVINLLQRRLPSTNEMVTFSANFEYASTLPEVDCKTVGFFRKMKIKYGEDNAEYWKVSWYLVNGVHEESLNIGKAWRKSLKRAKRASLTRLLARTWIRKNTQKDCFAVYSRLATSRPLGERSEPCLAAKWPTASDEVARGRPRHMKSDEGLFWKSTVYSRRVFLSLTRFRRTQEDKSEL